MLPKQWICLPELIENVRKRVTGGLALTLSLWPSIYVKGPLYSSTIQVNEFFDRVFSSSRILGNPPLLGNLFNFCNFQHFPTVPTKFFKQSKAYLCIGLNVPYLDITRLYNRIGNHSQYNINKIIRVLATYPLRFL